MVLDFKSSLNVRVNVVVEIGRGFGYSDGDLKMPEESGIESVEKLPVVEISLS